MAGIVIRISKDTMGVGDEDLGRRLVASFLNVLAEMDTTPSAIVLFNRGVFLSVQDSPVLDVLEDLEQRGVSLLNCGTCLNHFELGGKMMVGRESNMVEITETLLGADKVIPL
jgi:selenium metabolism protein YedF